MQVFDGVYLRRIWPGDWGRLAVLGLALIAIAAGIDSPLIFLLLCLVVLLIRRSAVASEKAHIIELAKGAAGQQEETDDLGSGEPSWTGAGGG